MSYWKYKMLRAYRRFYPKKLIDFQFEINAECNRKCWFCPNAKQAVKGRMEPWLIDKILNDLKEMNYKGRISPYMRGEPFMHPKIVEVCRQIREMFPTNQIRLETNAEVATRQKLMDLREIGVVLWVNDYTKDRKVTKKIQKYNDSVEEKYRIPMNNVYPKYSFPVINRANNVADYPEKPLNYKLICRRPFGQMFVTFDGLAVICSNDWYYAQVLGDVKAQSLKQIWESEKYEWVRSMLRKGDRSKLICKNCDAIDY